MKRVKLSKWIYRYSFFALLLTPCIAWYIYCTLTLSKLEKLTHSLEFIDIAWKNPVEAADILRRITLFEELKSDAFKAVLFLFALTLLLILYHVISIQVIKRHERDPKPKKEKKKKNLKDVSEVDDESETEEDIDYFNILDDKNNTQAKSDETTSDKLTEEKSASFAKGTIEKTEEVSPIENTSPVEISSKDEKSSQNDKETFTKEDDADRTKDIMSNDQSDSFVCSVCGREYKTKPKFCAGCGNKF